MTDDVNDGTDTLWQQYAAALLREAVGDDFDAATQAFSIGSILLFVDVAAADPAIANYAVFSLGNSIPPWSGSYIAASTLFTSYWSYLAYIDLAELAPTPVANGMASAEAAVRQQLAHVIENAQRWHAVWTGPTRGDPQSVPAQLQDLRNLGLKITGLRNAAANRARHHPANAGSDAVDAVIDALSRCLTAASPVEPSRLNMPVKLSATAIDAYVPAYMLPGLAESYQQWQANAEHGIIAVTIDVKADDADASPAPPRLAALRLPAVPFVSQASPLAAVASSSDYEMVVEFAGFGVLSIEPGDWFELELIHEYKGMLLPDPPHFFGEGGSMALLPEKAILGYQPQMRISAATPDAYATLKDATTNLARQPGSFGPFVFGEESAPGPSANDAAREVSFTPPPTTLPTLLGVISKKL
jgi:hypothetical protein